MIKTIDLFAGLGGFSEGATMAGMQPIWAGNHWDLACQFHQLNHPDTIVVQQDLQQADWRQVPAFDGMLASPACQGHSKARGEEKAHHDALRSTAWAVVACMEYHQPTFGIVENVPEFLDWNLYPSWKDALNRLGYAVAPHKLDAADFGVPQHRERVFIVLTKSKAPLYLTFPKHAHVPANNVIDWDYPTWSKVDKPGRASATLARIASGRARFGERFVAPFYGSGSGETGRSIHRPLGTVTTIDRWAVLDGDRMRVLQPHENLAFMSFPKTTVLPKVKRKATHLLGNAVAPRQACGILKQLALHI